MNKQVVYHPRYGRGIVQRTRKSGLEYRVRFDNGVECWLRTDEVELSTAPFRPVSKLVQAGTTQDTFTQRKVIEALRLGIVPDDGLRLFTVGREKEIAHLQKWLEHPKAAATLVTGTYGTGKTHLLNYFRLWALEAGYAVALVEMDPQETPFSKPKRVYSEIVRALRWKEGSRKYGFRQLIERGLQQGLLQDNLYFQHLRRYSDDRLWNWIQGLDGIPRPQDNNPILRKLPGLYDYSTAANIYCYLLSTLGWLCRSPAINLKGFLILFDESEALHAARGQSKERSVNLLDALITTANDDTMLLRTAAQTGFQYAGHASNVPFLYKNPSGLKLLFAFTSLDNLWISTELDALAYLELEPLHAAKVNGVVDQLFKLYVHAYANSAHEINIDILKQLWVGKSFSSTRKMIKTLIEALDISRLGTYSPEDDW
jgi:hypothetical protein